MNKLDFNMDRELAYLLAYFNGGIVYGLLEKLEFNFFVEILIGASICSIFYLVFRRLWGEDDWEI